MEGDERELIGIDGIDGIDDMSGRWFHFFMLTIVQPYLEDFGRVIPTDRHFKAGLKPPTSMSFCSYRR